MKNKLSYSILTLFFIGITFPNRLNAESFQFPGFPKVAATKAAPQRTVYVPQADPVQVDRTLIVKKANRLVEEAKENFDRISSWQGTGARTIASADKTCLPTVLSTAAVLGREIANLSERLRDKLLVKDEASALGYMDRLVQKNRDLLEAEHDALACIGDDPDVPDSL